VNVITVSEDTPMEEAAAILADNKIGGLPVVRAGKLAGIITATDLFNIFTYMLGARHSGVRAAAVIPGVKGTLAKITAAIAAAGGDILTFSEYQDGQGQWHLTLKITDLPREKIEAVLQSLVEKVIDVRDSPAIKPK
jgi:acetoin utilization protein AcuB